MDSNNKLARAAGILYLVTIIAGGFAEAFVREGLTVSGNAVATAQNILASEQMYRYGFVADLVYDELQKAADSISVIIEQLDEKEMRWLELSERV